MAYDLQGYFLRVVFCITPVRLPTAYRSRSYWAGVTQYVNSPLHQDSIFVFFSNVGSLRASHSTGNNASFKWYRYDPLAPSISERFVLFSTPSDGFFSQLDNLAEGGYRVEVTDDADSTETFTARLFY